MTLAGDRVSRGKRVQEIQGDEPAMQFCNRLNAFAAELGFPAVWSPARLSKVRNGTQDLDADDMTVLSRSDPKGRGYTWIAYGITVAKGEDAWAVLARAARKGRAAS